VPSVDNFLLLTGGGADDKRQGRKKRKTGRPSVYFLRKRRSRGEDRSRGVGSSQKSLTVRLGNGRQVDCRDRSTVGHAGEVQSGSIDEGKRKASEESLPLFRGRLEKRGRLAESLGPLQERRERKRSQCAGGVRGSTENRGRRELSGKSFAASRRPSESENRLALVKEPVGVRPSLHVSDSSFPCIRYKNIESPRFMYGWTRVKIDETDAKWIGGLKGEKTQGSFTVKLLR